MPEQNRLKKISAVLLCCALIIFAAVNYSSVNFTFVVTAGVLLVLTVLFAGFEKRMLKARDMMPIAVMCSCAVVGRVIFSFIPQIQPVTVIVMVMGVCLGRYTGFISGALCALISNMILGQGPWTVWQMLGWGIVGLICGCLMNKKISENMIFMCVLSFLMAFVYGFITDFWTISFLSSEGLSVRMIAGVYSASAVFNAVHGAGNVIFCILLYRPLRSKLIRIRRKYGVGQMN